MGEYIDFGNDTSKPEHIDELRSLQVHVEPMWGKRDSAAMRAMINAVLHSGVNPIYPSIPDHPRTPEEDVYLAYSAAMFILTPRHRLIRRSRLYRELQRRLTQQPSPEGAPRRRTRAASRRVRASVEDQP